VGNNRVGGAPIADDVHGVSIIHTIDTLFQSTAGGWEDYLPTATSHILFSLISPVPVACNGRLGGNLACR